MNSHWLTPHGYALPIYAGYLAWVITSNFLWLPHMGTPFQSMLATPHGYALPTYAGYPAWVLTSNFLWLPRMGAHIKLSLATTHGCPLLANPATSFLWLPAWVLASKLPLATPHGCSLQFFTLATPAWVLTFHFSWVPRMGATSNLHQLPVMGARYKLRLATPHGCWLQTHAGHLGWASFTAHWPLPPLPRYSTSGITSPSSSQLFCLTNG